MIMTQDRPPNVELVPAPQPTVVDRFLERHAGSPNTFAAYTVDLRQFARHMRPVNPQLLDWTKISIGDVEAWDRRLRHDGASAATRHRKLAALSSLLKWLNADGGIIRQIGYMRTALLPELAGRSSSVGLLDADQLRALRDAPRLRHHPRPLSGAFMLRDLALMAVLIDLGVKPTEACQLRVRHLNLKAGTLLIAEGDKVSERTMKTGTARAALAAYMPAGWLPFGRSRHGQGLDAPLPEAALFPNHHGDVMTRQGLWVIICRYAAIAGVEIEAGVLRRSVAAEKRRAGWSIEQIAEFFGVYPDGRSPVLTA